jgi:hypothetical protein
MQGSTKRNLAMFKKLCGDNALKNVILGTTMWDKIHEAEGGRREAQLANTPNFWGWMISRGSVMRRHNNDRTSALALIQDILDRNSTVVLEVQEELVEDHKHLRETGVGLELIGEIEKERERYQKELNRARLEMEESRKQRDNETTAHIEEVKRELTEKFQKSEDELKKFQQERVEWNRKREDWKRKFEKLPANTTSSPGKDTPANSKHEESAWGLP